MTKEYYVSYYISVSGKDIVSDEPPGLWAIGSNTNHMWRLLKWKLLYFTPATGEKHIIGQVLYKRLDVCDPSSCQILVEILATKEMVLRTSILER